MTVRESSIWLVGLLACVACSDGPTLPVQDEPGSAGARWATWVLQDGSVLRPSAPPAASSEQARLEIEEIVRLQSRPGWEAEVRRWEGAPSLPWTHQTLDLLEFYWPLLPDVRVATPARAARIMALLHVAQYDALVATWDAKYSYQRPPPFVADSRVHAAGAVAGVPSYPSEHAAVAGAAAVILSYAFAREDTAEFQADARRAAESRIAAGVAYRSDVEAGLALGRAVAERVIQRAMADGSDAVWAGSVPQGENLWRPTPPRRVSSPFDPLAGSWRPWVLQRVDAFRPEPPPALGSEAFATDLNELRRLGTERTARQGDLARFWATDAPSTRWELFLAEEISRRGWSALRAARAQALLSVAMYDAFLACWDAKFHYWLARPITADPRIATVFATPPFPSYPSGHSTISAAASEVMAELLPDAAKTYHDKAYEASLSRVWAGVHYRFDVVAGEQLGSRVGKKVVEYGRRDGSAFGGK